MTSSSWKRFPFIGRARAHAAIDAWRARGGALIVVAGPGGRGKTALVREWLDRYEGRALFFSLYEAGATLDTVSRSLARMFDLAQNAPRATRDRLVARAARRDGWMFVFDGLERALRSYHRLDAPYRGYLDDEQDTAAATARTFVDSRDASTLRTFAAEGVPLILTTRLIPLDLENGSPLEVFELDGLEAHEGVELLETAGVHGERTELEALVRSAEGHPLVLLLVGKAIAGGPARGDLAAWRASHAPAQLDLVHLVDHAIEALPARPRTLLTRMAACRFAVSYEVLDEISGGTTMAASLRALGERGFILHSEQDGEELFDLHPIVRNLAFDRLEGRGRTFKKIAEYFGRYAASRERVETLDQLVPAIEIYNALLQTGRLDEAWRVYSTRLQEPLTEDLGLASVVEQLLRPLFTAGLDEHPALRETLAKSACITALSNALGLLGRDREALRLRGHVLALDLDEVEAKKQSYYNLAVSLINLGYSLHAEDKLAAYRDLLLLICELGQRLDEPRAWLMGAIQLFELSVQTGLEREADALRGRLERSEWRTSRWADDYAVFSFEHSSRAGRADLEQTRERMRAVLDERGGKHERAHACHVLADHHFARGEWRAAREQIETCFRLWQEMDGADWEVHAALAWALAATGDSERARQALERALAARDDSLNAWPALAKTALLLGDRSGAEAFARRGYEQAWAEGPPLLWVRPLEVARSVLDDLGVELPELQACPTSAEELFGEQLRRVRSAWADCDTPVVR